MTKMVLTNAHTEIVMATNILLIIMASYVLAFDMIFVMS